ncbi:MAG: hypothetical protein LBB18_01425 [Puniceicoccales bacterium]|jgi:hypothetical protein|nr:hypothetical protein [Puniceicoccales bacterium]
MKVDHSTNCSTTNATLNSSTEKIDERRSSDSTIGESQQHTSITTHDTCITPKLSLIVNNNGKICANIGESRLNSLLDKNFNDTRRAFAQLVFPEEIAKTTFEGMESGFAIDLTISALLEFAKLGILDENEIGVIKEVIDELESVKSISEIDTFKKDYDSIKNILEEFYFEKSEINSKFVRSGSQGDKTSSYEKKTLVDLLEREMDIEDMHSKIRQSLLDIPNTCNSVDKKSCHTVNPSCDNIDDIVYGALLENSGNISYIAHSLSVNFYSKKFDEIMGKLHKGEYVCINTGWLDNGNGHCAYAILKKINDNFEIIEINSGGGLITDHVDRNKNSIYTSRMTPGVSVRCNERKLKIFLSEVLALVKNNINGLDGKARYRKTYERHIDNFLCLPGEKSSESIRPNFTSNLQVSGNCAMQSTDILVRTLLQIFLARKKSLPVNGETIKNTVKQIYRAYSIFFRASILKKYKDMVVDGQGDEYGIDAFSACNIGLGKFGGYLYDNEGKIVENCNGKFEKITKFANSVMEEVKKFILEKGEKVRHCVSDHVPIHAGTLNVLTDTVKNNIESYVSDACIRRDKNSMPDAMPHYCVDCDSVCTSPADAVTQINKLLRMLENDKNMGSKYALSMFLGGKDENFSFITDDFVPIRGDEIALNVIELLRAIPMPGSKKWKEYIEKSDRETIISLIDAIGNVISKSKFLLDIFDRTFQFLSDLMQSNDSTSKEMDASYSNLYCKTAAVVNSLFKARILIFELAKRVDVMSSDVFAPLDNSIFVKFCHSIRNVLTNKKDVDEQIALWNYVKKCQNEYHKKKEITYGEEYDLFSFRKGCDRTNSSSSPVCAFNVILRNVVGGDPLDEILKKIEEEYHKKVENMGHEQRANTAYALFKKKPGLPLLLHDISFVDVFTMGNRDSYYIDSYLAVIREKFFSELLKIDPQKVKLLKNFGAAMSYWHKFPFSYTNDCEPRLYSFISKPVDVFGENFFYQNSGFVLAPENLAKITSIKDQNSNCNKTKHLSFMSDSAVIDAEETTVRKLGECLSRPGIQTYGLLRILGDNFELCEAFGRDTYHENMLVNFFTKMWMAMFLRTIFPDEYASGQDSYNVKIPECPLGNEARERPYELLEAVKMLWTKANVALTSTICGSKPKFITLRFILHVVNIVAKRIMDENVSDLKCCRKVRKFVKSVLGDIDKIEGKANNKESMKEITLMKHAENELIGSLIDVRTKQNKEVKDKILLKFYDNMIDLARHSSELEKSHFSFVKTIGGTFALCEYFSKHQDQAKLIAKYLYDKLAESKSRIAKSNLDVLEGKKGEMCVFKYGENFVDLINFSVVDSGKPVSFCKFNVPILDELFGPLDINLVGNDFSFEHKKYGKITGSIRDIHDGRGQDVKIFRKFDDSDDNWLIWNGGENDIVVDIPMALKGGGDITNRYEVVIFVNRNGRVRICRKDDMDHILYEIDSKGRLVDTMRRDSKKPAYISLNKKFHKLLENESMKLQDFRIPESVVTTDVFSRFDSDEYILRYYDDKSVARSIVMAGYETASGDPLSFELVDGNWVLSSNRKYKVVEAPKYPNTNELYNPLLGYKNAIWMEDSTSGDTPMYKCLLPMAKIYKNDGLTHKVSITPKRAYTAKIYNACRYGEKTRFGEVTFHFDKIRPGELTLRGNNTMSTLMLAYIFQTQSEYVMAAKILDTVPMAERLSNDELDIMSNIIGYCSAGNGEVNACAAAVVIKALARTVQFSKKENRAAGISLMSIDREIEQYLLGLKFCPPSLRLFRCEEIALISRILPIVRKERNECLNLRKSHLDILGKKSHLNILDEEDYLDIPVEKSHLGIFDEEDYLSIFGEENAEYVHTKVDSGKGKKSDFDRLMHEDVFTRTSVSKKIENTYIDGKDYPTNAPDALTLEKNLYTKLLWIGGNQPRSKETSKSRQKNNSNACNSDLYLPKPELTDEEKHFFGDVLTDFMSDFKDEMDEGKRQLDAISNDSKKHLVPSNEQINELRNIVAASISKGIESAKKHMDNMLMFADFNRSKLTKDACYWESLDFSKMLRYYGIYISGAQNCHKRAFDLLTEEHPWVSSKTMHFIMDEMSSYLSIVTSVTYLEKVQSELTKLSSAKDSANTEIWKELVPLLRQVRPWPSEISTDINIMYNVIFYEHSAGIRLRQDQIENIGLIIEKIRDSNWDTGILVQQIMGSGKTKVLMPFLISYVLRNSFLPIIVPHVWQLPSVSVELPPILSNSGIRMDIISMNYGEFLNLDSITILRKMLETSIYTGKSCLVMSSHTLLAMRTAYRSLLDSNAKFGSHSDSRIDEFSSIFRLLKSKGVAFLDEVHITLNPKESFIVRPATSNSEFSRISDSDATFIVDVIYNLPHDLIGNIKRNSQDTLTPELVRKSLLEHIKVRYVKMFEIDDSISDSFAKFICGEYDGAGDDCEKAIGDVEGAIENLSSVEQHQVAMLRHLASSMLVLCLSKTYGENYGYDDGGKIVPYRNRVPTSSNYKNPYERLCYYAMATLAKGLPRNVLKKWVEESAAIAISTAQNNNITPEETCQFKLFKSLFEDMNLIESVNLDDPQRPKALEHAMVKIQKNLMKIMKKNSFSPVNWLVCNRNFSQSPILPRRWTFLKISDVR